ncbi:copper amine oxidase N-terminal domain-containing protein [Anoxynatronum sibiricum]|uniref:Copper amine oxidase N-terminal domain-containing protein n=1 Tax=Anoxynatronum sibiricum TaxID=210623 RepID=A0ABU9VWH9_9CLOT
MKKTIAGVFVFLLLMTGIVFASGMYGSFEGLPIVKVVINNKELVSDVPGVVLNGRTMLPVKAIAEQFDAVVKWNSSTQTVDIIKPEVQLLVIDFDDYYEYEDIYDDDVWVLVNPGANIFPVGMDNYLLAYFDIGPMPEQLYTYRIALFDPSGNMLKTSVSEDLVIDNYGAHGVLEIEDLALRVPGNYKLAFQMKYGDKFETVTNTTIIVE